MINQALLWYLLLPIILSACSIFVLRKWVPGFGWGQAVGAAAGGLLISALITTGFFYVGKGSKTADTEIWNGEIISKARTHGSYTRSYECRCYTTTSGSGKNAHTTRHCSTCYEDHYTVKWTCDSNIGGWTIESFDRTSRSVYNEPDPWRYTMIKKGDPVSTTHDYTNYIKAVPQTLFRPAGDALRSQFVKRIPAYPLDIYDIYHVNRVLSDGVAIRNIKEWNDKLSEALKKLGPQKQANAVVVLTTSASTDYFFALQDAWLNGKKNDIVVVIGAPNFPNKASWVRIMALTKDQIFQVKLRDTLLDLNYLSADAVVGAIEKETYASFKRKSMKDFAYLDAEIDPPAWIMITCMIINILAYVGFWLYAYTHRDYNAYGRFGTPRFRY